MAKRKRLKRRVGAPTKLTPKVQKIICDAVRRGNYIEVAAALAGVHKDTLYEWQKRGNAEERRLERNSRATGKREEIPFMEFTDALKRALAQSEDDAMRIIDDVAEGYEVVETTVVDKADGSTETTTKTKWVRDWHAAAWRQERRFPKRWARKQIIDEPESDEQDNEGLVLVRDGDPDPDE